MAATVAGCSGGSTAPQAAGSSASTTLDPKAFVLTTAPAGFTSSPNTDTSNGGNDATTSACIGGIQTKALRTANGPDFSNPTTGTFAGTEAEIHNAADVSKDVTEIRSPAFATKAATCLRKELAGQSTSGVTLRSIDAYDVSGYPGALAGFRVTATLVTGEQNVPEVLDVILLARGSVESTITVGQAGTSAPDSALESELTKGVSALLAKQ